MSFLNFIISGISLGSIYAIIALGYTMVYGIAKMLNFAHGDVIMVGAYICFYATTKFGLPPLLGDIGDGALISSFIAENRGAIFGKKIGVFACQAGSGAEKTFERLALTLGLDSVPYTLVLNDPLRKPSEANEEKIRRFAESFRD